MNNVEQRLAEGKRRIDTISAPDELEKKLRSALYTAETKRIKRMTPFWKIAAVVVLCLVIVGNQYNAFAYYGKKLLGFDEVLYGTLKDLNEEGYGQIVDKAIELEQGTTFTINGIMNDANQFVMFYTLMNPTGLDDSSDLFRPSRITGFFTNSNVSSGVSILNEDHTEIKGTMTFEAVSPFSKKLTLHFWHQIQNGNIVEGDITFPYNPNQALATKIIQPIKKTVKVDKGTITFASITATPTSTVINGSLKVENFDRVKLALDGIELWANGAPIELMGSGSQSSFKGRKFELRYDVLPDQLDSLELIMKEFVGYQLLDEKVTLSSISDKPILLNGKELWIKNVSTTSQGVSVTITTDDDVMLDGVSIEAKNELISLRTTVNQVYTKQEDGRILKERTLLFDTTIEPDYLLLKGMHYMKTYNQVIEIPVD